MIAGIASHKQQVAPLYLEALHGSWTRCAVKLRAVWVEEGGHTLVIASTAKPRGGVSCDSHVIE